MKKIYIIPQAEIVQLGAMQHLMSVSGTGDSVNSVSASDSETYNSTEDEIL